MLRVPLVRSRGDSAGCRRSGRSGHSWSGSSASRQPQASQGALQPLATITTPRSTATDSRCRSGMPSPPWWRSYGAHPGATLPRRPDRSGSRAGRRGGDEGCSSWPLTWAVQRHHPARSEGRRPNENRPSPALSLWSAVSDAIRADLKDAARERADIRDLRTEGVIGLLSARLTCCWAERRSTWSGDRKLQRGPVFQITRFTALVAGSGINRMPEGYQESKSPADWETVPPVSWARITSYAGTGGSRVAAPVVAARYRGRPSRIRV